MRNWIICFLLLISACSSGNDGEEIIDFELEIQAYGTEASTIRDEMILARTAVAATVVAAESQADNINRYNLILGQTAVAIFPPTSEARIVANDVDGPLPPEVYDLSSGEMRFVQIGPAGQVDDNGCFMSKQQFFRSGDGIIYMTAVALNLRAGTTVRADWQFGSELVYSNSLVAPQSESYRCIALSLRPSDAEFMVGNWSVTLSVDGDATEPRSFTILSG